MPERSFPACFLILLLAGAGSAQPPDGEQTEEETSAPALSLEETVVVTPERAEEPIVDSVALVTVLDAAAITESPGILLDEALGRIPGFGLFRRNTSLISHPTTTGVSLRGIGPSGASRTLVLRDGVPMNDPFGNWVYWNRLPTLALERVEVARGAASPLYGSSALGGAIQLLTRRPAPSVLRGRASFGNLGVRDGEALVSHRSGDFGFLGAGRFFNGKGYHRIRELQRGMVDEPAGVNFRSAFGRFEAGSAHLSVNYYTEDRRNGTPTQVNDSAMLGLDAGVRREDWDLLVFSQTAHLNSDFSRILPGRDREIPTSQQMYEYGGQGAVFTARLRRGFQVGADWVRSSWDEHAQNRGGVFVQKRAEISEEIELLADGRLDVWQNAGTKVSVNPRIALLAHPTPQASLRASAYRGFRAPSLNELYRPFRVGNVRTAANDELGEETLYGAEIGIDLYPTRRILLRGNVFWNTMRNVVGNVTLEVNDEGVFRERRNIGEVDVRGAEAELWLRLDDQLHVFASYLLSDSSVPETGLWLPQVPLHQGAAGISWSGPVEARADVRFMSSQFEDDRNELPMDGFVALGVRVALPVGDFLSVYAAGENLLDAEIVSARTPIETLGTPRTVHVGLDFRLN